MVDAFVMQSFRLDKVSLKGERYIAAHEIGIAIKEHIGSGGMRECHKAII